MVLSAVCCRRALIKLSVLARTSQTCEGRVVEDARTKSSTSVQKSNYSTAVAIAPETAKEKKKTTRRSASNSFDEPPDISENWKAKTRNFAYSHFDFENDKAARDHETESDSGLLKHEHVHTKSQILQDLDGANAFYRITDHNNFFVVDCMECSGKLTSFISPFNASTSCTTCGVQDQYANRKKELLKYLSGMSETLKFIIDDTPSEETADSDFLDKVILEERHAAFEATKMAAYLKFESLSIAMRSKELDAKRTADQDEVDSVWKNTVKMSDHSTSFMELQSEFGFDKFSRPAETLDSYHVRGHLNEEGPSICYPRFRNRPKAESQQSPPQPVGLKLIRMVGEQKKFFPSSCQETDSKYDSGIFGWHLVVSPRKEIVVTTNEKDALAVYDATGRLSVALPRGNVLDHRVLPYLADFEKIILWFPPSQQDDAKNYASKLGDARCHVVSRSERPIELVKKNDLDGIKAVFDLNSKHLHAVRLPRFRAASELRSLLRNDIINHDRNLSGLAQWERFPVLNDYLKGFRPGELTVITGGTGVGKTTFICESTVDLMNQGIRTLMCSFEMKDEKVLKWMVIQFAKLPLYQTKYHAEVDQWLDKFERMDGSLIMMNTYDFQGKSVDEMASAIREQVVAADIQHVVIDNLQFLVGSSNTRENAGDKYDNQDAFVRLVRRIATETQAHVSLVVHPRKEPANTQYTIESIGGTGRVAQEADTVLVIQRPRQNEDGSLSKFLYILKNRFGQSKVQSDLLEMVFEKDSYTHKIVELTSEDVSKPAMKTKKTSI